MKENRKSQSPDTGILTIKDYNGDNQTVTFHYQDVIDAMDDLLPEKQGKGNLHYHGWHVFRPKTTEMHGIKKVMTRIVEVVEGYKTSNYSLRDACSQLKYLKFEYGNDNKAKRYKRTDDKLYREKVDPTARRRLRLAKSSPTQ